MKRYVYWYQGTMFFVDLTNEERADFERLYPDIRLELWDEVEK